MMHLNEIEKNVKVLLSEFKKTTKALACSILDKDGFILWTNKEIFDDLKYDKFLISLYTYTEINATSISSNKTTVTSITYNNNTSRKKGNSFLIRAINNDLYLISIHPLLSDQKECVSIFDKICYEIQSFLSETKEILVH